MRRTLVLLLLLAGLAAVAVLLIMDHGAPRGAGGSGREPGADLQDPARGDPLAGSGAAAGGPERQPGIQRTGTEPEPPPPPLADGSGWVEIEVIRRDDRTPVAGAEVLIMDMDEESSMPLMEEFFLGATVDGIFDKFGVRHLAGPDGRVRVPVPGPGALLAGRKDQLFGVLGWGREAIAAAPGQRVSLEVETAADLRIRVTDENGQPAEGVMVALRVGAGDYFSFDLLRARTGADGIGAIPRAAAFATLFSPTETATYSASIAAVLPEPVLREVYIAQLPAEPVELRLPPTGTVRVSIRAPDGSLFREPLLVALAKARENPEDDDDWMAPGMPGFDAASQRALDGAVRFDHVGLGLPIQVSAVFPGAPRASVARAQGPQRAGETVELVLTEQRNYPVVLAQIVGADGKPLANQLLQVQILMAGDERDWSNQHRSRTDAEGRIRLGLMPVSEEEAGVAITWQRGAGADGPELHARTELSRPFKVGENDLGIVKLAPAPILASGRVLDPEGRPLAHASVTPARRESDPFNADNADLNADYERRRETDAQGAFTLTGSWSEPEVTLEVEAEGFLTATRVVVAGARDLEIRLASSYALKGRILADAGVDLRQLSLDLAYREQVTTEHHDFHLQEKEDGASGSFEIRGAAPGLADLVILMPSLHGPEQELFRITGILVGGAAADPRLDPIDLRGKLYGCKFIVRGADGAELDDLRAMPVANPAAAADGWHGSVSLISLHPLGEVEVSSPGWRPARLTPVLPTEHVELAAGLQVRISADAAVPGGCRLGVLLLAEADPDSWWRGRRAMFDGGTAVLTVSQPGTYEVAFLVAPPAKDGDYDSDWNHAWVPDAEGEPRQRIEVRETGLPQSFRLSPPPAERIAEAMRILDRGEDY